MPDRGNKNPDSHDVNIVCFNVNGLAQKSKRAIIFQKSKSLNSTVCLQETHGTKELEISWEREWEGKMFFSHGTSNSKRSSHIISY